MASAAPHRHLPSPPSPSSSHQPGHLPALPGLSHRAWLVRFRVKQNDNLGCATHLSVPSSSSQLTALLQHCSFPFPGPSSSPSPSLQPQHEPDVIILTPLFHRLSIPCCSPLEAIFVLVSPVPPSISVSCTSSLFSGLVHSHQLSVSLATRSLAGQIKSTRPCPILFPRSLNLQRYLSLLGTFQQAHNET